MSRGNKPVTPFEKTAHYYGGETDSNVIEGLTIREHFAAMAMQGLLANAGGPVQPNGMNGWALCNCTEANVASFAADMADALIAQLAKATP